jgi:fatty-acyl-CoA synthase
VATPLKINYFEPSWSERRRLFINERNRINYANFVDKLVDLYKDRTAFVLDKPIDYPGFSGDVLSYRDVGRLVNRMAAVLQRLGVRKGDRVGMITMNRIEMAFVNFAAGKLGAIPVPMNFMLRPNEIEYIVQRAGIEVLVCDPVVLANNIKDLAAVPGVKRWAMIGDEAPLPDVASFHALMETAPDYVSPTEPDSPQDVALLFFTSGTTGFPKGAMLTHEASMVYPRHHGVAYALFPRVGKRLSLLVMPVAHAGGYAAMLTQLFFGTAAYFVSKFDAKLILETAQRIRATSITGTPAMFRMLLEAGARDYDLSSVTMWGGGADAFDDELIRTFREMSTRPGPLGIKRKASFIRGYGMAESNSYCAQSPPFEAGNNLLGWVIPPVQFRIVDEEGRDVPRGEPGELLLRGPNLTIGYWNDPEATEQAFLDGWFRTGDIVRQGKWRMLYFVGRSAEIIKSGGYKIAALELDEVLQRHPAVEHAASVGIPDPVKGERPMSAVKLHAGANATAEEILAWARERLAPYKCPRQIFIMDDLPFTFSMKPKRREVRDQLIAMLES